MRGVQVKSESPPDFVPGDQKRIFLKYLCDLTQGNQPLPQGALLPSGSQRETAAPLGPDVSQNSALGYIYTLSDYNFLQAVRKPLLCLLFPTVALASVRVRDY